MVSFKLVIGTKDGKCVQKELQEPEATILVGKKLGDSLKGDDVGLAGYEFAITGGSDNCGFPMRKDVDGINRKKVFEVGGVGLKKKAKGSRQRKTVCGNTIHENITQINLKITKEGKEPLAKPKEESEGEEKKE